MLVTQLAAALLLPLAYAGMYADPVVNLDAKSFRTVMSTEHAAVSHQVDSRCGHCKNLGPEYTAAASSLSPLIPFYAVDCDAAANKPLCAEHGIKGFPTIKAFPRAAKGAARDYNGERKRAALVEYAKELVPDRVKKLRADTKVEPVLDKFLAEKSDLPHALLIHPTAPSIPFLWKVLGHRLSGKAHLGYIKDTASHGVLSAVGMSASADNARLVFWQPGSTDLKAVEQYDGALKFNGILEWLESHLGASKKSSTEPKPKPKAKDEDAAARRAKAQAKLDQQDRRDQERRAKAQAKPATPVEEAQAVPPAGAEEAVLSDDDGAAANPEPPQKPGQDESAAAQTGHVHEEL
ncbi:hypothetical protein Q5752_001243 [Cryptotrichosporon argae]